ncbi:hypothetical protein DAPPUDRAFT_117447 [Daphnia pulex]|uniref:Uncharacterized protein n=1 Tax=Daphnia pulex TaxID=6669 RepID=E9HSP3_DAPPU|nr:hypothetical protein DAPPUDRAFT_117447 [Daphnia pulex]|eukprot:EFX65229.1 hypothetical protein DAPPUDRAFT_117447 [Daphnia pulex]
MDVSVLPGTVLCAVLAASYAKGEKPAVPLNIASVEKMMDSQSSGLVPQNAVQLSSWLVANVLEDIEQTRVMLRRKSGNVSIVMDDINPSIDSVLRGLKLLTDLSIDIVLIQEPYAISGPSPTLANVPPRYAAFHALSSDHAYGATIFLRQTIADSGRVKLMHRAIHSECIEPHFRPVPKVARLDKQLFHKFLGNQLSTFSGSLDLTSESSVILEIETLTSIIVKCARAARIRTAPLSFSAKNMPWWSRELCALRTKTRKAFKVWSHDKSESNRASYKTAKSIYQKEES